MLAYNRVWKMCLECQHVRDAMSVWPIRAEETRMSDPHAEIIERLVSWARADTNIRALIQTGSSSQTTGTTDRFSDRDIEIIALDVAPLLTDDAWIHAIGPVWVGLYLENDPGDFETRLVFFEGSRKVDFTIADRSRIDKMVASRRLNDLYERGYQLLLDKDDLAAGLPEATGAAPKRSLPTATEFTDTVTEFWFEAAHMPTYLVREDLWVVKFRDWTMKEMLLRMLEWRALATNGPETDTWCIGTRMKQWLDAETWNEVNDVFGRFDRVDAWRGLLASLRLFTRLTRETAELLGFDYPVDAERHITSYILGFEGEIGDAR
jgi:aminoglycoside 6-adenylyltransferase